MIVNWGKKEFSDSLKELQVMIDNETDIRRKLYLERVHDYSCKMYADLFCTFKKPTMSAKQRLNDLNDNCLMYGRYYSIVSSFTDAYDASLENIDAISENLEEIDSNGNFPFLSTGATLGDGEIVSLIDKFYQSFDEELYQYFLKVYKDPTSLNILPDEERVNKNQSGSSFFIDGVLKNFLVIYKESDIGAFASLVHEYGHAIHNLINPDLAFSDKENLFVEVASIFPEMVALYETQDFDRLKSLYTLYTLLVSYIDYANSLMLHIPIINSWKSNNYVMSHNFFQELENNYGIDDDEFGDTLEITMTDEGTYVISFIVALELFNIYRQDKKKALKMFKDFLKMPADEENLAYVVERIGLNKNTHKECQFIINSFEKELKKRRY